MAKRFLSILVVCLSVLAGPALAGLSPPPPFVERRQGDNLLWSANDSKGQSAVNIIFQKAEPSKLPMRNWFEVQIKDLAKDGVVSRRNGLSIEEGTLYKDVFDYKGRDFDLRALAFAYETPKGHQMFLVLTERSLNHQDQTVQKALDAVADLWRSRVVLDKQLALNATSAPVANAPANAPATPAAAPAKTAQSGSGGRCRLVMRTITTSQLQRVCYPSVGGVQNCSLNAVPVQQQVEQEQCD